MGIFGYSGAFKNMESASNLSGDSELRAEWIEKWAGAAAGNPSALDGMVEDFDRLERL